LWEYFRDFVAAVGIYFLVSHHACTTTTKQNRGNISAILLQLCEYFCVICIMLTNHQPTRQNRGNISAISLQSWEYFCVIRIIAYKPRTTTTRQNRGNVSAILLQPWECFSASHVMLTRPQQPAKSSVISLRPQVWNPLLFSFLMRQFCLR